MTAELGNSLKLNSPVARLIQTGDGWRVSNPNGEMEHGAVIYCGTAYRLAELQVEFGTPSIARQEKTQPQAEHCSAFQIFSEIRHPPVASVVLGFRREDVAHLLDGFGMLIPKIEGLSLIHI